MNKKFCIFVLALGLTSFSIPALAITLGFNVSSSNGDGEIIDPNSQQSTEVDDFSTRELGFVFATGDLESVFHYKMQANLASVEFDTTSFDGFSMNNIFAFRIGGNATSRVWIGPQVGWFSGHNQADDELFAVTAGAVLGADFLAGEALISPSIEYRDFDGFINFENQFSDDDVEADEFVFRLNVMFTIGGR